MANKLEQVGNTLITSQDRLHTSIGLIFSNLLFQLINAYESLEKKRLPITKV